MLRSCENHRFLTMRALSTCERRVLYDFLAPADEMSEELFDKIVSYFHKQAYPKGAIILSPGQKETKASLVVKGVVLQQSYRDGEPLVVNITPAGLSFNSLKSYLNEEPSDELHRAVVDTEVIFIYKKDLELLARQHHEFSYLMFKVYERILLDRENRMLLLQHKQPASRFRLFHQIVDRARWILLHTPDKYIANYLNMTPQQYCSEKKKMLLEEYGPKVS